MTTLWRWMLFIGDSGVVAVPDSNVSAELAFSAPSSLWLKGE
jgi:hypothetical protein